MFDKTKRRERVVIISDGAIQIAFEIRCPLTLPVRNH